MKFRLVALCLLVPLVLWNCATPPGAPPSRTPTPTTLGPDDDHRTVGVEEFLASPFRPLPAVQSWTTTDHGVALVLGDGTKASLTFVAPDVVRWWVAGPETPWSPGVRYGVAPPVEVVPVEDSLVLQTPTLVVRFDLGTLSWSVTRGGQPVLATQGGPKRAGRRLVQTFQPRDLLWSGPGLSSGAARHWTQAGTFATPAVFGLGSRSSVALVLDSSYQTYTASRVDGVVLGALNGGLDLVVSVGLRPDGVVQGLTALTGRPAVVPDWVHGTTLALPAGQTGAFVRKAKLSIEGAWGTPAQPRPGFRVLAPVSGLEGDPTADDQRRPWAEGLTEGLPPGVALGLNSDVVRDWNQSFDDQGQRSPLARMAPLLPRWEAQGLVEALRLHSPTRPLVLTTSGGPGIVREALPLVEVGPGSAITLGDVLAFGLAGLGTPAVRLNLSDLAQNSGREAIVRLAQWMMIPILILDWGPDPEATWAGLPEAQRRQVKTLLDHRSRFKPHLIQQSRTTAFTGRPAWVPLWFDHPTDPRARLVDDEFVLGNLLVVPLPSGGTRKFYLPGGGVWFDFWTGEEFGGGRSYEVEVRGDRPLVFARAGALVGVREPEAFDGRNVSNPPTFHVFPGAPGVGTYWVDDGVSEAWKTGSYHETKLRFTFDQKSMSLEHQALNPGRIGADPYLLYRLHNLYKPRQVRMAGKAIPLFGDSGGVTDSDRSAAWYEGDHTLLIKVFRPERDQAIDILF